MACPRCAFPIAEELAAQRAAEATKAERSTRTRTDLVTDCEPCKGRGFEQLQEKNEEGKVVEMFRWCDRCNETGRLPVLHSDGGYWTVALEHIDEFLAGDLDTDSEHVTSLGSKAPPPPSYPAPKSS